MRRAPLLLVASITAACGVPVDQTWHERDGHRWLDATACDARRVPPAAARCVESAIAAGLGVCGDLAGDNTLTIDARSSGPLGLAVEGTTRVGSPMSVDGDFVSEGRLDCPNTLDVTGTLYAGDAWSVSSPAHVHRDAWITGALDASNTVRVDGTLHVASSTQLASSVTAGTVSRESVVVRSPLDCAHAIDVAALVDAHRDGSLVAADLLAPVSETSELTLGCGTYVLSSIAIDAPLTLHVEGDVVLVVLGDVRVGAPTTIDVASGGTFDWLVRGALEVDNTLDVSSVDVGAVWVAVGTRVRVGSPMRLAGDLVAPDADLAGDNTLEVWGAVMAHDVRVGSPMVIHDGTPLSPRGCLVD